MLTLAHEGAAEQHPTIGVLRITSHSSPADGLSLAVLVQLEQDFHKGLMAFPFLGPQYQGSRCISCRLCQPWGLCLEAEEDRQIAIGFKVLEPVLLFIPEQRR
jgi:hypothetical protein